MRSITVVLFFDKNNWPKLKRSFKSLTLFRSLITTKHEEEVGLNLFTSGSRFLRRNWGMTAKRGGGAPEVHNPQLNIPCEEAPGLFNMTHKSFQRQWNCENDFKGHICSFQGCTVKSCSLQITIKTLKTLHMKKKKSLNSSWNELSSI